MKTENIREWLTPTLISAFVFCPRLFFLSIFLPFDGRASPATVLGSLEHDAFGAFDQKTRNEFFKHGVLSADLVSAISERIDSAVDCAKEIAISNYPQFYKKIDEYIPTLKYRLQFYENERYNDAKQLITKGVPLKEVVDNVTPFAIEESVSDPNLLVRGRIDAIFKITDSNGNPHGILRDIKSHKDRLPAWIWQQAHVTGQLGTYTLLAPKKFPDIPFNDVEIFYTQNLEIERFKIDESYKDKLINIISLARDSMYETIPPKLTGSDAIKCQFCYKRKACFGMNDNEEIL